MSTIDVSSESPTQALEPGTVDMHLEVDLIPVSDIDRSKKF